MRKYLYYGRKPRGEIAKDIIMFLVVGGVFVLAGGPHVAAAVWKKIGEQKKRPQRKFASTFNRLGRQNLIIIEQRGHDVRVSLTEEGRKAAGYMQINDLVIQKQKRWDGIWRIVVFDISILKNLQRNAFRGKLKELGFIPLQKSVWVQPFPCKAEIDILRDFYGLGKKEVRLIEAHHIDGDTFLTQHFFGS